MGNDNDADFLERFVPIQFTIKSSTIGGGDGTSNATLANASLLTQAKHPPTHCHSISAQTISPSIPRLRAHHPSDNRHANLIISIGDDYYAYDMVSFDSH